MNSKPNYIKPAFAPETEFEIQALITLPGDRTTDDSVPTRSLELSIDSEFVSWPRNPFSALND
jgi:hypothetical protein